MAISFTVFIDASFDAEQRRTIGEAIVEYVFNRTKRGRGVDNVPFTSSNGRAYSKAYQDHRDFVNGGKNNRPINLSLTGDMLNSLKVMDVSLAGRVVIGIADDENAEKARFMREKGYNFLGISDTEQRQILARFQRLTPQDVQNARLSESIARQFLRNLFNGS